MNVAGHLSVADLLNLVVLWSIPIQRNDEFKVKADHVTMNADAHTHQSMFTFCTPPNFHSTPINSCTVHLLIHLLVSGHLTWVGGLFLWTMGSLNIEMFTCVTGVITPSSMNQFVSSSGPPMTVQLDAALPTTGLSKEQAEEIFLLTHAKHRC